VCAPSKGFECVASAQGVSGPLHPGQEVNVPLKAQSDLPVMLGRLVNASGMGLGNVKLTQYLAYEFEGRSHGYQGATHTDAQGHFRATFSHHKRFYEGALILQSDSSGKRVRVPIPRGLAAGVPELGDLSFSEPALLASGKLALSVLMDDANLRSALRVHYSRESDTSPWRRPRGFGESSELELSSLQAGAWKVSMEFEGQAEPIFEAHGIIIKAGETTHDPRISKIDLRHQFTAIQVRILGDPNAPSASGYLSYRNAGEGIAREIKLIKGQATIYATSLPLSLVAEVPGLRSIGLDAVRADCNLELSLGLPLHLVLPSQIELPKPPLYLAVELRCRRGSVLSSCVTGGRFLQRELELQLGDPGAYELRWRMVQLGKFDSKGMFLNSIPPQVLEVSEQESRPLLLDLDAELLGAALSKLSGS
jgi:hypothetical protein